MAKQQPTGDNELLPLRPHGTLACPRRVDVGARFGSGERQAREATCGLQAAGIDLDTVRSSRERHCRGARPVRCAPDGSPRLGAGIPQTRPGGRASRLRPREPTHVGKSALWNDELTECCFQNTVIRFRAHSLLPEYALVAFRHFLTAGDFARRGAGWASSIWRLPPVAQMEMPVPNLGSRRGSWPRPPLIAGCHGRKVSLVSALQGIEEQVTTVIEAAATGQLGDGAGHPG